VPLLARATRDPHDLCLQLRIAVWTGDPRDTRPEADIAASQQS
jgi:hypothetical protein